MSYKSRTRLWGKVMAFHEIFHNENNYNEKNILGFISFSIMVVYSIIDLITGILDVPLALHEYIYQSFIWITLGSFGIGGLEKFSGTERDKVSQRNRRREISEDAELLP